MAGFQEFDIAVEGGRLHVAQWGEAREGTPVILCSHGLTANHTCWQAIADQFDNDVCLIAPDHRGRGKSNGVTGPFGMDAHARDMVAILDHLNLGKADLLIGHSMGGFVAAVAGAQDPARFPKLMFIDGGLPAVADMPEGVSAEELALAVVGPSVARLDMRFESIDAYREFWRVHPCFQDDWSAYVEAYIDYDLIGEAPELRSGVAKDAIIKDIETQLMNDLVPDALQALTQPVRFVQAPFGMANTTPLYTAEIIEDWGGRIRGFSKTVVPDVNHFTIVISDRGAKALAEEIRQMLG